MENNLNKKIIFYNPKKTNTEIYYSTTNNKFLSKLNGDVTVERQISQVNKIKIIKYPKINESPKLNDEKEIEFELVPRKLVTSSLYSLKKNNSIYQSFKTRKTKSNSKLIINNNYKIINSINIPINMTIKSRAKSNEEKVEDNHIIENKNQYNLNNISYPINNPEYIFRNTGIIKLKKNLDNDIEKEIFLKEQINKYSNKLNEINKNKNINKNNFLMIKRPIENNKQIYNEIKNIENEDKQNFEIKENEKNKN